MKKFQMITKLGISALVVIFISFFLIVVPLIVGSYAAEFVFIVGWVFFGISSLLTLIAAILILIGNFEVKEVEESRILWGILSLLLIGPIGVMVFVLINKKYYSPDYKVEVVNNDVIEEHTSKIHKTPEDNLETITKAFKLFEAGAITQEEFDKIKENQLSK